MSAPEFQRAMFQLRLLTVPSEARTLRQHLRRVLDARRPTNGATILALSRLLAECLNDADPETRKLLVGHVVEVLDIGR